MSKHIVIAAVRRMRCCGGSESETNDGIRAMRFGQSRRTVIAIQDSTNTAARRANDISEQIQDVTSKPDSRAGAAARQ